MTDATPAVRLLTIGFTKKTAREFFTRLREAYVRRVVDIRLNNASQLAGFTKKDDLAFFLQEIGGIDYVHRPDLAPTGEILAGYKKKAIGWPEYEMRFNALLAERHIETLVSPQEMDLACLLCSEPTPAKCHRRLVAEYLQRFWPSVTVTHL
jgi:uncharacterized protein (DUF488 family)